MPDDYQALRKDADRLAQENADLRRENGDLRAGSVGPKAERGGDRERGKLELPSEEEIDKAISQVDKYLKKFKGLIEKYGGRDEPGRQL